MRSNVRNTESTAGLEAHTRDVPQRTFAIAAAADPRPILRTGNIQTCVAFYGVHPARGIAFLCHIDGSARGIGALVTQLKAATGNDLPGFSLYCTPKWTLRARQMGLAVLVLVLWGCWGGMEPFGKICGVVTLLVYLVTAFLSVITVLRVARRDFGAARVAFKPAPSRATTIGVWIKACHGTPQINTFDEDIDHAERLRRYGVPAGQCWHEGLRPMPAQDEATAGSFTRPDQRRKGADCWRRCWRGCQRWCGDLARRFQRLLKR